MSWSVQGVGKPEALKRLLQKNSEQLTGQSKEEFDQARPHLEALIDLNTSGTYWPFAMKLVASGSASFSKAIGEEGPGVKTWGNCSVELTNIGPLAE